MGGSALHSEEWGIVGEGCAVGQSGAGGCQFEERGRAGARCWWSLRMSGYKLTRNEWLSLSVGQCLEFVQCFQASDAWARALSIYYIQVRT
jgi:hypothetical protein